MAASGASTDPPGPNVYRDNLITVRSMLYQVLQTKPARNDDFTSEMSDTEAEPVLWVTRWMYYDKYGLGYQLSDESFGSNFKDGTKLIMLPNRKKLHYVDVNGGESYMRIDNYPKQFAMKVRLLSYSKRYLQRNLLWAGPVVARHSSFTRTRHVHMFFQQPLGNVFQLNNGTVQINLIDHIKIIMCPLKAAITFIADDNQSKTFRFSSIERNGCCEKLFNGMRHAYEILTLLTGEANEL